ncbi:hypothetical protein B0H19DRAFT_1374356 [Mycena capillaripes]|nr:hypothetical protein B0H19DRAFT_1374356 [Mycena capillaripes]
MSDALTRVEELWFSDGGLVVQAEESLFRVSGGILAALILPDSATDVTCFFKAIFDSSFFEPRAHPYKVPLQTVISILHLSNKYGVDYLLRRALVHFSSNYPTTLSAIDAVFNTSSVSVDDDHPPSSVVAAIRIAREVDALWILPAAFYYLAATDEPTIQKILNCIAFGDCPASLSAADQIVFLKSSMQISLQGNHLVRFLHTPNTNPGCQRPHLCTRTRLDLLITAQDSITGSYSANPLAIFTDAMQGVLANGTCRVCYDICQQMHDGARQAIWDKLPEFCGLPPWAELEKMKASALA